MHAHGTTVPFCDGDQSWPQTPRLSGRVQECTEQLQHCNQHSRRENVMLTPTHSSKQDIARLRDCCGSSKPAPAPGELGCAVKYQSTASSAATLPAQQQHNGIQRTVCPAARSTHACLCRIVPAKVPCGACLQQPCGSCNACDPANETDLPVSTQKHLHTGAHPCLLKLASAGAHRHLSRSQKQCSPARLQPPARLPGQSRRSWCRKARGQKGTAQAPAGRHRRAFGARWLCGW